jgi:CspA family cold shock protein
VLSNAGFPVFDLLRHPERRRLGMSPPEFASQGNFQMTEGTVKFFNTTKGFGFIEPVGGGKDAFVHISAVERSGMSTLREGQKVSYDLETGRDGKVSATNLKAL